MKTLILKSLFLLLFSASFALAQNLQLEYPSPPGTPSPSGGVEDFFRYLYTFLLIIGGILAVSLVFLGGFFYLTSFGNLQRVSRGKELIVSALLGAFILFSSHLILNTLDPYLVTIPNLRIRPLVLPSFSVPVLEKEKRATGCQPLNLQAKLEAIFSKEKEALDIAEKAIKLDALQKIKQKTEEIVNVVAQCDCSKFQPECLVKDSGSPACPARCPPSSSIPPPPSEDPCPPELRSKLIPELEEILDFYPELFSLIESFGFDLTSEQEDLVKSIIDKLLIQDKTSSFSLFVDKFIKDLEELVLKQNLSSDPQERKKRIKELERLFSQSLWILTKILTNITTSLAKLNFELEKILQEATQARTDIGSVKVLTCYQALAEGKVDIGECVGRELDLYYCK